MSLNIFQSWSYISMTEKISQLYYESKLSPFHTDTIVYQSRVIKHRLPVDIAKTKDVFAGTEFVSLTGLEDFLINKLELTDEKFNANSLKWVIFKYLNNSDFQNKHKQVYSYYEDDEKKQILLAIKIRDLFLNYLTHYEELIGKWMNNECLNDSVDEIWQKDLFNLLLQNDANFKNSIETKINFCEKLSDPQTQEKIRNHLPRIFFFGISYLTKHEIRIIKSLSKASNVNVFMFKPCLEYDCNNNELIKYNSKVYYESTRNFADEGVTLNNVEFINPGITHPATCLGRLQEDIITGENSIESFEKLRDDGSIQIMSNYTPVREVESLYNYLLKMMAEDKDILPKDILVLVPELDKYVAFIKSVFESNHYIYNIPFSIEFEKHSGDNTPAGLLNSFLNLDEESFTSEKIVRLLENSKIAEYFKIDELDKIREWVKEANIRREFKVNDDIETETYIVSFYYGLQRLIMGFALGDDIEYLSDGSSFDAPQGSNIYPVGQFEGSRDILLLARFKEFVYRINNLFEKRRDNKTIKEWIDHLRYDLLYSFLYKKDEISNESEDLDEDKDENESPQNYLEKKFFEFMDGISEEDNNKISYDTFKILFQGFIESDTFSGSGNVAGVKFAPLKYAAGYDYKIVAILGANYDILPSASASLSFDLLSNKKDCSLLQKKEIEKYTFLQSVISARKSFYISYIGRSSSDNSIRPPSLLTEQLLACLGLHENKPDAENKLFVQCPIHSFSSKYNNKKYPQLVAYDVKENITHKFTLEEKATDNDKYSENDDKFYPDLKNLINFFKDSAKLFFNKKLSYYIENEEINLPEYEKFELEHSDEWKVKNFLLECESSNDKDLFIKDSKYSGLLPLSKYGTNLVDSIDDDEVFKRIKDDYEKLKAGLTNEILDATILLNNNIELSGSIEIYGSNQIVVCTSSWDSTPKYLIAVWLKHLFATVAFPEKNIKSYIVLKENKINNAKTVIEFNNDYIDINTAKEILVELSNIYLSGLSDLLPFIATIDYGPNKGLSYYGAKDYKYKSDYLKKAIKNGLADDDSLNTVSAKLGEDIFENFIRLLY